MGSPEQTGAVNRIPTNRKLRGITGRLQCKTVANPEYTPERLRALSGDFRKGIGIRHWRPDPVEPTRIWPETICMELDLLWLSVL